VSGGQPIARMKTKNSDQPLKKFVRGPSLQPRSELFAWLEGYILGRGGREIRVPLVLAQGQVGFSLRGDRIGAAADAIEVYANDSALGIGLADRALTHCKGREPCAFWVEGRLAKEADGAFRLDVMRFVSPIKPDALASANFVEVEELAIPEPAEPVQGFPMPKGARRNKSMGGATTLAPGRNYTISVYDIDSGTGTINAFYERHLPEAKRTSEEMAVTFSTPQGNVKVARFSKRTRITLTIGPQ